MVSPGQFLERPTLIPVGEHVMEGVSHRGRLSPLLLVLSPPPNEGGMDHIVGAELAFAASNAGFPTLRFNYRGVGASQGTRGSNLLEDALAALEVATDNARGGPVLVASINGADGLALKLLALKPDLVPAVCLISPSTTGPSDWSEPVWVVVGEHDAAQLKSGVGRVDIIPSADRAFQRGLPRVGKAVVACLTEAARSRKH